MLYLFIPPSLLNFSLSAFGVANVWILAILKGRQWNLIVVLIYNSLMTYDAEFPFTAYLPSVYGIANSI